MERRRRRKRRRWSSIVARCSTIVTLIIITITFWNVIRTVNVQTQPITTTIATISTSTGIGVNGLYLPTYRYYNYQQQQQQQLTQLHHQMWPKSRTIPWSSSTSTGMNRDDGMSYTLMTWNLLAPVYATHEKYSYCSKRHLDWNQTRFPKIIETIMSVDADIVCLQEVQIDTWYRDFLPYFRNCQKNDNTNDNSDDDDDSYYYYTGILQNVTRNHPIACATLIKTSKFHIGTTESRSRAIIVSLRERQPPSVVANVTTVFFIANVHLDARYDQDITRYNQIKSLLHRIEYHDANSARQLSTTTPAPPIIIVAGDFNMVRTNPIYTLLSTGQYTVNQDTSVKMNTRDRNKLELALPFLPLHDVYNNNNYVSPQTQQFIVNATRNAPLNCDEETSAVVLRRTFAGGSILDYIWISDNTTGIQAVPFIIDPICCNTTTNNDGPSNAFRRRQRRVGGSAITGSSRPHPRQVSVRESFHWPSKDQPSDHIPIGIRFHF